MNAYLCLKIMFFIPELLCDRLNGCDWINEWTLSLLPFISAVNGNGNKFFAHSVGILLRLNNSF